MGKVSPPTAVPMRWACSVRWRWWCFDAHEHHPGLRRCDLRYQPVHREPALGFVAPSDGQVLAEFVPHLGEVVGAGTVLVDGPTSPTWDWWGIPDLYSAKAGYPGMNLQIAATLEGRLAAVGLIPVHGARHDAHAFAASGLAAQLATISTAADLGYVGVEGIEIVPIKRAPGGELATSQAEFNTAFSKIRAAVEHAIAHLKTWRMLSEGGGPYRAPTEKYQSMLKAVIGLYFFAACE